MIVAFTQEEVVSTPTVSPLRCIGSNTQFSVVGWGNRSLELRSAGVLWQENQRREEAP